MWLESHFWKANKDRAVPISLQNPKANRTIQWTALISAPSQVQSSYISHSLVLTLVTHILQNIASQNMVDLQPCFNKVLSLFYITYSLKGRGKRRFQLVTSTPWAVPLTDYATPWGLQQCALILTVISIVKVSTNNQRSLSLKSHPIYTQLVS